MISLCRLFALLCIFGFSLGLQDDNDKPGFEKKVVYQIDLNGLFDNSLDNIRHYISVNGFDPLAIEETKLEPAAFTELHLHHGVLQQLSTINRTGDIILQYNTDKIALYMDLGFEVLDISYEYTLKYMLYTRKGDCYSRFENVKARLLLEFDLHTRQFDMKFFKFLGVGDFEFKLEGHLIDVFLNQVSNLVTKHFRDHVLLLIEKTAYTELDKLVQKLNAMIPSSSSFASFLKRTLEYLELKKWVSN